MQEHVYNICDILSVLRLKTCKRRITPTTHTERRTLRSTHTPLTEHRKRSNLERMRSRRRRRAAAVYPPPYREVPSKRQPSSAPKTPPKFHEAPPPGLPPLVVRANLVRPVLALRLRAIFLLFGFEAVGIILEVDFLLLEVIRHRLIPNERRLWGFLTA